MIKVIGLDLDDTLYDRNLVYKKVYHTMEKKLLTTNISFKEFDYIFQKESLIEFQKYSEGIKNELESKIDRVLSTYYKLGYTLTNEQALVFHKLYLHFKDHIEVRPHMLEIINYFHSKKIEMFILTNGSEKTQLKKIKQLGIDRFFSPENIFISEKLGIAKPNKKVFDLVEASLGFTGKEIMYVGDHYENDIVSCQQNNWTPIYYNVNDKKVEDRNVIQFFTDEEIYKYIKNEFS